MKILFFLAVFCFSISLLAQSEVGSKEIAPQVIVSDVASFWKAYDLFWQDTTRNPFENYLAHGSVGLMDFIPNRINSAAALKSKVVREKHYYDAVRSAEQEIDAVKAHVNEVFASLRKIYAEASMPHVYFVIGRISSGGTATSNGIIIGYETFSRNEVTTSGGRKSLSLDMIPSIVAHEAIHFQQKNEKGSNTLLKISLLEGGADFIADLMGYNQVKHLNGNVYEYGEQHEKELWEKFKLEKDNLDYSDWLYNQGRVKGRPSDLGYWMGYKICAAYYNNAAEKGKAIQDILQVEDYEAFLIASGYDKELKHIKHE
jgi:hypothetical protein